MSTDAFLAGFGKPLSLGDFCEHVVTLLTDLKYESATGFSLRGKTGAQPLNA